MKSSIITMILLLVVALSGQARGAECYEGVWEVVTKTAHQTLEIKDDGCLNLTVTPKDKKKEATHYSTCYKIKEKKKGSFIFDIDQNGKMSTAEVICSGKRLQLKWGDVDNHTYRPVKK